MNKKISGTELLKRFAWPCAQEKLDKKLINKDDYWELKTAVENNTDVDNVLLTLCFPNLVRKLRHHAMNRHKNMWAFDTVYDYLLNHHDGIGECASQLGIIEALLSFNGVVVILEKEKIVCLNPYHLSIEPGNTVLIHRRVIVYRD